MGKKKSPLKFQWDLLEDSCVLCAWKRGRTGRKAKIILDCVKIKA